MDKELIEQVLIKVIGLKHIPYANKDKDIYQIPLEMGLAITPFNDWNAAGMVLNRMEVLGYQYFIGCKSVSFWKEIKGVRGGKEWNAKHNKNPIQAIFEAALKAMTYKE